MESEPPYLYVRGNPIRFSDPTGFYAEGDVEKFVGKPLFSFPTGWQWLSPTDYVGHEPWLRRAVQHPLMANLYTLVAERLRKQEFEGDELLPEFYSGVRGEARRLLLKDGLCGVANLELEAAHLAIITIAAIPAEEHNTAVRPKNLWSLYPYFLPDGRVEEPGWDKTGHFFNHAFLTFEYLYMRDRQMPYYSSLAQTHKNLRSLTKYKHGVQPHTKKKSNLTVMDILDSYYYAHSGSLYVNDTTNESGVYNMSRDIGLFYEIFSIPYPIMPNQDIHYFVFQEGHPFNQDIILQGLFDPGVYNDISANKLGAKFGIDAYSNPTLLPPRFYP